MSFFTSNRTDRCPGPIVGNPLNGICEKVCIVTRKVFDSCINQFEAQNLDVTVTSFTPENPTFPLTFIGCSSTGETATTSNLSINRFDDRPNFARVTVDVNIPININYTDANGVPGTATGTITINQDVVMYVPQPSLTPIDVVAFGSAVIATATYNTETGGFTISACVTVILKVVAVVDVLVPSYGYCPIPPCTPYTGDDVCPGVFDLPLFPTAVSPQSSNAR